MAFNGPDQVLQCMPKNDIKPADLEIHETSFGAFKAYLKS
jgi:hypothetical protein